MELGPEHLKQLSKDINSTLGNNLGEFRRVAADSNKNIGSVVKDISKMFASQKRDMADVHEALDESNQSAQRTAVKVDRTNSILQETITLQNNILDQLKVLNGSMNALNTNMQNNNAPGLISSILDSKFGTVLKGLGALGGIAGAAWLGNEAINNYNDTENKNAQKIAGLGGVKPINSSGNLAQNQQEAYKAAVGEGLSEKSAKILVANMSGESLKNPGLKRWDRFHYSQGIVQWDDKRSADIKQHFGKYPQEMTVAEQTKAAIWEMKTQKEFAKAWEGMTNERLSDQERMYSVVKHYEKPQFAEKDTQTRLGYLGGLKVGNEGATPQSKPEAMTSGAAGGGADNAPAQAEKVTPERHGGIISGAMGEQGSGKPNGEQGKLGTVNPGILAKFKEVQSQAGIPLNVTSGFRDQKHNAEVGGAKNSAHTRGNAVDVTFGGGIPETLKMIDIASKSGVGGIGVYRPGVLHFDTESKRAWGPDYHRSSVPQWAEKAIEGHLSGTGSTGPGGKGETTPGSGGSDATPESKPSTTPGMNASMQESGGAAGSESGGAPQFDVNKDTATMQFMQGLAGGGGMGGMMGGMGMGGMGGMATMMPGMMGGMGGMGGMMGMAMPMLQQLMSGGIGSQFTNQRAEQASMNTAMINASQLEQQLNENNTRETLINHFRNQDKKTEEQSVVQGNSGQLTVNDYNGPEDIGWPDWAAHLGISGSKFRELDKVKIY